MTNSSNFTLTIEFNDPELDPEERNEEAQLLMRVLKGMDEIESIALSILRLHQRGLDPRA
jgi:hypothetical protein